MSTETPQDRLEELLKTPYPSDGDVWSAFLAAFGNEFDEIEAAIQEVQNSKFVEDATGQQLEKLASIYDRERETGESDDRYRLRVKLALRELLGDGTLDEVQDIISELLDIDPETIILREPTNEILTLEPRLPVDAVGKSGAEVSLLNDKLNEISAAGINASAALLSEPISLQIRTGSTTFGDETTADAGSLQIATSLTSARTKSSKGLSASELEPLSSDGWVLSAGDLGSWNTGIAAVVVGTGATESGIETEAQTATPQVGAGDTVTRTKSSLGLSSSDLAPLSTGGRWNLSNAES